MRASIAYAAAVAWGCLSSGAALAQIPAGGEFQVNTYTTGNQPAPHVSSLGGGGFVVVWDSDDQAGIMGRRYDAAGAPLGGEFQVDVSTTAPERYPSVAGYGAGRFIVTWGEGGAAVLARRFDAAGGPVGAPTVVATPPAPHNSISNTHVAAAANGTFAAGLGYGGPTPLASSGAFTLFDASGATICTASARGGDASMMPDGGFVGAWTQAGLIPPPIAMARRFDATCGGPSLPLNSNTALWAVSPSVAATSDGNFVIAWASGPAFAAADTIVARRFDLLGTPVGAEFQVSTYATSSKNAPTVGMAGDGSFQVAWISAAQDASSWGVFARRFRPDGTPREGEFQVNTYTTGAQAGPRIVSDANGNFVVAWQSAGQDGSGYGVFAQRFGGIRAVALALADGGNDVLEPGETASVSPSWRNVNGAAQAFGGSATSFGGPGAPGDPTYTLSDAVASYGTVANGATASCATAGDCYEVAISVPTTRPTQHWDARVIEELTPAPFGLSQVWLLHVGGSFGDMPATNPFYRFVETLLHRGVTGGCAAGQYCGASSTTREQMAVFALTAKEGAGYAPQACGTPVFSDVPASSPFCRWIEELARRGVVSGCGGGRYCPQDAVSREQMAIFMLRTLDPALNPPACAAPMFADVPASSPFCRWIEELARRGVVTGCGGGNYCPGQAVTRQQMGVFIAVTFGLTLYGP